MKKKIKELSAMHSIAIIALIAIIGITFIACDGNEDNSTHTHSYSATWSHNTTQHYKQCSCGEKIDVENHVGNPCSICNYNSGSHSHSYSETWSKDVTQHWKECSCGDKTQVANHSGNPCVCGYDSGHSHTYGDTWSSNATQHWHECSCGDKTQIANHTGSPCTVCGYRETHIHSYSTTWIYNTTQHYKQCSCGDKIDIENHNSNPCTVCGYSSNSGNVSYKLGDTGPGGGIIFYYYAEGFIMSDNGTRVYYLEAAPEDMPTTLAWASSYIDVPNTSMEIGTGRMNTSYILSRAQYAPAAKACNDYRGGGKTDWFLPSVKELNLLYTNSYYVNNLKLSSYWSSYQPISNSSIIPASQVAIYQNFSSGIQFYDEKTSSKNVRPIRAF